MYLSTAMRVPGSGTARVTHLLDRGGRTHRFGLEGALPDGISAYTPGLVASFVVTVHRSFLPKCLAAVAGVHWRKTVASSHLRQPSRSIEERPGSLGK